MIQYVIHIVIDPQTPSTLYAVESGLGMFKSTDGGMSWSAANTGLKSPSINDLIIDPKTPTTLYAGTSGAGVFKSTDSGGSWRKCWRNMSEKYVDALAIDPVMPANLYAITSLRTITGYDIVVLFKSTNGGVTWERVTRMDRKYTRMDIIYIVDMAIDPKKPTNLYLATNNGVYILHQQR